MKIALIAHDKKKSEIIELAKKYKDVLANGELDLIIFLRDPLTAQPHEPDVSALLRLCDVQKIPLATNVSSATIMLETLKSGKFSDLVVEFIK